MNNHGAGSPRDGFIENVEKSEGKLPRDFQLNVEAEQIFVLLYCL